ncbi:hypothetical protein EVJ58_g7454 [Rhodofomes roseus]|uniref:Uncharacterized protein n=1 Tax=Rhodofomes roseus TaxID=34475 RepID=A0A4Y9Y493_9APHY|nr:hypothetical protein EVJ58_g7454 [Rhodofomes roseus]
MSSSCNVCTQVAESPSVQCAILPAFTPVPAFPALDLALPVRVELKEHDLHPPIAPPEPSFMS